MYQGPSDLDRYGLRDESYYYTQQKPAFGIIETVKPHLKKIIALIVVLVIAYFLYYYFFASFKEVEFNVNDTEGKTIGSATVKIYPADNLNTPITQFEGSKTIKLRAGDYVAEVSATGYKAKPNFSFTIDEADESPRVVVKLEKKMDVEIFLEGGFPTQLVKGQNFEFKVRATNTGTNPLQIEFVFEDGLSNKYVESIMPNSPIDLPAGETKTITFNAKMKSDLTAEKKSISATIRVKYLNNPKAKIDDINYTLLDFSPEKVKISGTLDFGKIKAGAAPKTKSFNLYHTNKNLVMKNITISVKRDSITTSANKAEDIESWLTITPSKIPELEPEKANQEKIDVTLSVPISAKPDEISGNLLIKNDYYTKLVEFTFEIQSPKIGLDLTGMPTTSYNLQYNDQNLVYKEQSDRWTLKNTGEITITDISIAVESACALSWIELDKDSVDSLAPGTSATINVKIRAPASTEKGTTKVCKVHVGYIDPTALQVAGFDKTITIKT